MFKQTILKLALTLTVSAPALCMGQVAREPSIADLIEKAKHERAARQLSTPANMPNLGAGLSPKDFASKFALASVPSDPLLWSLTGMNNRLVAEIYFQGKVHVLNLDEQEKTIGPWQVERFTSQGVWLAQSTSKGATAAKSLYLPAPSKGSTVGAFGFLVPTAADSNMNSLQAASQLPLPINAVTPALPTMEPGKVSGSGLPK